MIPPEIEERLRTLEEDPLKVVDHPELLDELLRQSGDAYGYFIETRQHDQAITLMERLRQLVPHNPDIRRLVSLACGGKAELIFRWADQLGVVLRGSLLTETESLLSRAIETDPTLPDPYWDMAVLKARFQGDFDESDHFYQRVKAMGYHHAMMPALEQMLQQRPQVRPQLPEQERTGDIFRELLLQLIVHPNIPPDTGVFSPSRLEEAQVTPLGEPVFDAYCRLGAYVVRDAKLEPEEFENIRQAALRIDGDAGELVRDLLRRVSVGYPDDFDLQKRATDEHLKVLAQTSFAMRAQSRSNDDNMMRRARRAASRGLKIVEATTEFTVDPDIHAELLLAIGQTYARVQSLQDIDVGEALRYYLQALGLKKQAGNLPDYQRLQDLMKRMIAFLLPTAQMASLVGQGNTLRNLETAYEAVKHLDDTGLAFDVAITLSNVYSRVRQPELAEELLRNILSTQQLTTENRDAARLAIASTLSEQGRAAEAAEIQSALIAEDSFLLKDHLDKSTLYMNYGNSLREMGNLDAALEAFQTALKLALEVPERADIKNRQAHIHTLLGQAYFLKGEPESGESEFKTAESLFDVDLSGTDRLHFHSVAGKCYFEAGMPDAALVHLDTARKILREQLAKGPRPSVWESMLREWAYLDALTVEHYLTKGNTVEAEAALLVAESAKGRLLTWLGWAAHKEAPELALSTERQESALRKVQKWTDSQLGRHVVCLFAADRGLAVFLIGRGGTVSGKWLAEARYDTFMTDFYEPWEYLIDASWSSPELRSAAGALTELLLDKVGEWLWEACPELKAGGDDLILVPHRLFRSLPLSHCRLPGSRRLSEGFQRVMFSPSLYSLSVSLERPRRDSADTPQVTALVDPDGSLPSARLEGILAAGLAKTKAGSDVTIDAFHHALSTEGIILLSCHGDFDEKNPWQSELLLADGKFTVPELMHPSHRVNADLIVLGVCEAARTRRSLSDEPLGFPSVLVQEGVGAVIAPMWKVDDFSSLLFLSRFFQQIRDGEHPAVAVQVTGRWLAHLKSADALNLVRDILDQVKKLTRRKGGRGLAPLAEQLQGIERWLITEPAKSRPFRSVLDWASFQVVGFPKYKSDVEKGG